MTTKPKRIPVKFGGMIPASTYVEAGTKFTPISKPGPIPELPNNPSLIWAKEDNNNGSIIIIDKETVEINGKPHKLALPLKLNHRNHYCIWINEHQPQP